MSDLCDQFDVRVISLPERSDRRQALQKQFATNGISWSRVRVFDAVRPASDAGFPTVGAHGCFLSHLTVMKEHTDVSRPLLVCEDDLDLDRDFPARIDGVLERLHGLSWDLVFFGAHLCGQPAEHLAVRSPAAKLSHLHMVAYQSKVLPRLIEYLEAMLARPAGDSLGPMHVDDAIALFRRDNPDVITRVVIPALGHQRASPSDIQFRGWHDRIPVVRSLARPLRHLKNWLHATGLWRRKPTA